MENSSRELKKGNNIALLIGFGLILALILLYFMS